MVKKIFSKAYTGLIFLFLYAPILVLILFSFNEKKNVSKMTGFTLHWYGALLKDRQIMQAVYYTLLVAVISSLVAVIIGTMAAIGLYNRRGKLKTLFLMINKIPLLNPDIVTAIALMSLFVALSQTFKIFKLGLLTMLIAHITFNIPYVILSVMPKLKQMPSNTVEAAMDLGASQFYALRKVVLPEIMPGIITGMLIAFTMSIDDFVISFFTTGGGVSNISMLVFSSARVGINPKINALSTLLFLTVMILLIIINKRTKNSEGGI